jgi:hypothetical protein
MTGRPESIRGYGTAIDTSLDGVLVPQAFFPRTRTKYVPGLTVADRLVNVEPVSAVTILVLPVKVPASITYDVGPPADGFHDKVTVNPLRLNVNPFGALGGPVQGPLLFTTTTTSLEDPPAPTPFWPRTRTK